ncbi:single-stranded DNA-binding protein [Microbacterium sp. ARD32]|uniref:single-stranded DNA-binding protein n=1 Tax=Microbacterium sp. ARD32 TaxID=2962577 RepID=UPI0028826CBD|nr:single-stranded DNA-binding protein [Microbacterium sp. ARD32]MDT0157342.1 single-stranded DNA-binding protein [Microbacterium sp. ARD32]
MTIRNDTIVIAGNIGNDPVKNETRNGKAVINFRVATSSSYLDQRTGEWVETPSSWYAVSAFGHIAEHAKASLHCGDPVIVVGRLKLKEWESGGRKSVDAEITADSIGHDLSWGTSAFVRRQRAATTGQAQAAPATPDVTSSADDETAADESTAQERDAWEAAGLTTADGGESTADAELAYS